MAVACCPLGQGGMMEYTGRHNRCFPWEGEIIQTTHVTRIEKHEQNTVLGSSQVLHKQVFIPPYSIKGIPVIICNKRYEKLHQISKLDEHFCFLATGNILLSQFSRWKNNEKKETDFIGRHIFKKEAVY